MFGHDIVRSHSEIVVSEPAYTTGVLQHGQLPDLSVHTYYAMDGSLR
jgi:hypothetical protein